MCRDCCDRWRCCERTPTIHVSEGFANLGTIFGAQNLLGVREMLGYEGGIELNTQLVFPPPSRALGTVWVGVDGTAVTIADVTTALRSIPRDAFRRDRIYHWWGITLSPCRRYARIEWGWEDIFGENGLGDELGPRVFPETGKSLAEDNQRLRQENLQLRQEGRNLAAFVSVARDMRAARAGHDRSRPYPHVSR